MQFLNFCLPMKLAIINGESGGYWKLKEEEGREGERERERKSMRGKEK